MNTISSATKHPTPAAGRRPKQEKSNSYSAVILSIFHVDFIEQIKAYLGGFVLGKCLKLDGSSVRQYITCYTNSWILQRGDEQSKYWACKTCGIISQSGWSGPQYILRGQLGDCHVYMSAGGRMYIDDSLASELDFSPWPDTLLERIAVRDEPQDGQCFAIERSG